MTKAGFDKAVEAGTTLVCEVYQGGMKPPKLIRGTPVWVDGTAHVRTPEGALKNAKQWPSHGYMFTPEGRRVNEAVTYLDAAATAEAILALSPRPSVETLVDALADEVDGYRQENGWLGTVAALEAEIPEIARNPRVTAARAEKADREAREREEEERRRAAETARFEGMTATATGGASAAEARAIRERISRAVKVGSDGTARQVKTAGYGPLPILSRHSLDEAKTAIGEIKGLLVPVGDGRHMAMTRVVRVRWEESPDETDVSGVIYAGRGQTTDTAAAGDRNRRTIRAMLAKAAAKTELNEALSVTTAEAEGLLAGSVEITAARKLTGSGYGTRWYLTPDQRVVKTHSEYDFPGMISASPGAVKRSLIAKALGIRAKDIPTPA